MKNVLMVLLSCFVLGATVNSYASDPVDLRGKKGVVDPNDLKKYDPKPPAQKGNPPPSPTDSKASKKK